MNQTVTWCVRASIKRLTEQFKYQTGGIYFRHGDEELADLNNVPEGHVWLSTQKIVQDNQKKWLENKFDQLADYLYR